MLLSGVCFPNYKDYLVDRFGNQIYFIEHGNNAKWAGKKTQNTRFEIICCGQDPDRAKAACMQAAYARAKNEGLVSIVFGLRKDHGVAELPDGVSELEILDGDQAAEHVANLHNLSSFVIYLGDLLLYGTDCKFSVPAKVFSYVEDPAHMDVEDLYQ